MNILINLSNLSGGGGGQVADSVISLLNEFPAHQFYVVYPTSLNYIAQKVSAYKNVDLINYNFPTKDWKSLFTGRNSFLDSIVNIKEIDVVLTLFGPMKWVPKCKHVVGFALAHLVLTDSPYFTRMPLKEKTKWKFKIHFMRYLFRRNGTVLFSENQFISEKLKSLYPHKRIFTITNNYNQVFDHPELQEECQLPQFNGFQLLDIASAGEHKNQKIAIETAKILKRKHPDFKFRFVFTIREIDFPSIPADIKKNFYFTGPVKINQCPYLYKQCDAEFQPTLLECFTATYPEAMKMRKPIITTDLEFSKSICRDAAMYYEADSPEAAAEAIYKVATDDNLRNELIRKGEKEINNFDTPLSRIEKLISICQS